MVTYVCSEPVEKFTCSGGKLYVRGEGNLRPVILPNGTTELQFCYIYIFDGDIDTQNDNIVHVQNVYAIDFNEAPATDIRDVCAAACNTWSYQQLGPV